ncbi:MAG: MBL fold metallo-hydrolase, partial [Tepidisphaeraceae bacterium]
MTPSLTLRLWGVRGSIPSPGPATARYGGNTPCVSVEMGDKILVLDAGTGIRILGKELLGGTHQIFVLLTHEHWDHIQGFPFFAPIYEPERRMVTFPIERGMDLLCSLIEQMDGAHFPVTREQLPSLQECCQSDPMEYLNREGFHISRRRTNHPGKCYGYRIDHAGKSLVFMPDNELHPPVKQWATLQEMADFCHGADVLMHDAQFVAADMPKKRGWGHSMVSETCELAALAQVKQLVLFHHDPERTDDELDEIQRECRA